MSITIAESLNGLTNEIRQNCCCRSSNVISTRLKVTFKSIQLANERQHEQRRVDIENHRQIVQINLPRKVVNVK